MTTMPRARKAYQVGLKLGVRSWQPAPEGAWGYTAGHFDRWCDTPRQHARLVEVHLGGRDTALSAGHALAIAPEVCDPVHRTCARASAIGIPRYLGDRIGGFL